MCLNKLNNANKILPSQEPLKANPVPFSDSDIHGHLLSNADAVPVDADEERGPHSSKIRRRQCYVLRQHDRILKDC